jgi:hypothetical protein
MSRLRLRTDSGGAGHTSVWPGGELRLSGDANPWRDPDHIGRSWSSLRGEAARCEAFATSSARKGPSERSPRATSVVRGPSPGSLRRDARWPGGFGRRLEQASARSGAVRSSTRMAATSPLPSGRTLKGERSPGRTGAGGRATDGMRTGPDGGAKPRSRRNGRGATAAVTRCGYQRGTSFEGYESNVAGKAATVSNGHLRMPTRAERSPKRGEPQDRQRDETSPRALWRRKPSRW